jgi:glycosyltransferase involved in cell wall biosynthesis
MDNKNIWIFSHYAVTPDFPGGTRHYELAKNLSLHGNHVTIFASNFIHMNLRPIPMGKSKKFNIEHHENLSFIWIKTVGYKKNNLRRFLNMLHYCWSAYWLSKGLVKKKVLKKPDIIIGSTVHPFAPVLASYLAKNYQIPFIFEICDLWPQTFVDMGIWSHQQIRAKLFKWIEKHTVNISQGIVVLSPLTITYLKENYNFETDRAIYVPNGVNLDLYNHNVESSGQRRQEAGEIRLVYLGGVEMVHGLDGLFKAMEFLEKENSPITLYIYGSGKHKDLLKRQYPLSNIRWMGAVKKCEVPKVLSCGDLLYMSTGKILYGSENKLFEYLASAKPVISSVYSKHNDIVEKINAGISVSPGNKEALIQAIKTLGSLDPAERKRMGNRGRTYVEKNHLWTFLAKRLNDFINKINNETIF